MNFLKLSIKQCADKRTDVINYSCEIIVDGSSLNKFFVTSFDNTPEYIAAEWLYDNKFIQRKYALHSYCNSNNIKLTIENISVKNKNSL